MVVCPYAQLCWRNSYSRYLLDIGYQEPPVRFELFLRKYATSEMMPNHGIFADNMPIASNGTYLNLCPMLNCVPYTDCHEYTKESRRRKKSELNLARFKRNPNARPRVALSFELKHSVALRDHWKCVYCHRVHNSTFNGKRIKCHVDHFIPIGIGGDEDDPNNLVLACSECNLAKGMNTWELGCRVGYYKEI